MPAPEDLYVSGTLTVLVVGAGSHNVSADTITVDAVYPAFVSAGKLYADTLTAAAATPSMDAFLVANPSFMLASDVPYPRTAVYPMHVAPALEVASGLLLRVARDAYDGGALSDTVTQRFGPAFTARGTLGTTPYPRTVSQPVALPSPLDVAAMLEDGQAYAVYATTMTAGASTFRGSEVEASVLAAPLEADAALTVDMVRTADIEIEASVAPTLHPQLDAAAVAEPPELFLETFVKARVVGEGAIQITGPNAWTANTDNWAMSRYAPFEMDSVASWGGKLYATGDWGLVELSGQDDRGVDIFARLDSHLTDFKNNRLKLPRALYLGYKSEQPLTVTMSATDSGEETAYTYSAPTRLADTFVPDRVPVGRGLRSRYFRYSLQNESGGYFSIDTAFIDADVSERRV